MMNDYNISLYDNEQNEHVLKEGNNTINEIEVNKGRDKESRSPLK